MDELLDVIFALMYCLLTIAIWIRSYWEIFIKAGRQGWESIIPIYNVSIFLEIIQVSPWCILLFCIPPVNLVFYIVAMNKLSMRFGKNAGFTVGLIFLPVIFLPILAFYDSKYTPKVQYGLPEYIRRKS